MEPQAESPQEPTQNTPPPAEGPTATPPPTPAPKKPSNRKRLIALLVVLAIVIAGAAGYALLIAKDDETKPVSTITNNVTTVEQTATKALEPYAVLYKDYTKADSPMLLQPLDGSKAITVSSLPAGARVSDVFKNQVLAQVVTEKGGEQIWYSKDAGKSFTKLFTGATQAGDVFSDQITSVKFSIDGTTAAIAILKGSAKESKNTVKQLNLSTGDTEDIVELSNSGVFIARYQTSPRIVYYRTGCYNCDGGPEPALYLFSGSKVDFGVPVYEDPAKSAYMGIFINNAVSKIALIKSGTNCEGPGSCKPYTLEEYDIAAKTTRKIAVVESEISPAMGYLENGTLYYASGSAITLVDAAGKESILFQSALHLVYAQYVSKDRVVAQVGSYEDSTLVNYDAATKKSTNVMNLKAGMQVSGVTWQ